MITSFAIECIEGTLKKVQTIVYKNGQTVKRIFEPSAIIPEDVKVIAEHQGYSFPVMDIEHPEVALYRHHFGV
jgi:hypothetical protein